MTVKIYCDNGGWEPQLELYKREPYWYKFFGFPAEEPRKNKNLIPVTKPSVAGWSTMGAHWKDYKCSWEDLGVSEKFNEIQQIVGEAHMQDIQHLDSAYKEDCQFFLTRDRDILDCRSDLEKLLNLKIFNPSSEIDTVRKELDNCLRIHETEIQVTE